MAFSRNDIARYLFVVCTTLFKGCFLCLKVIASQFKLIVSVKCR